MATSVLHWTGGAALLLLAASASPAHATTEARCGTGLIAGMSICIEWRMKLSEYRSLIARANRGDAEAALKLAQFEDEREDRPANTNPRNWWLLAAERGECQALRRMRNEAIRVGKPAEAGKWRTRIRWNQCAPTVRGERWLGG
ncbi:hypothetical protein P1X14_05500 [Sphingomonas sp. AOB5]|uniref:hypothetical protein n=1 Tax=Sphingomonas sp. AOB5 TaxID=3034017 RepID=UPI0023F7DDFE|nr:hypothetical protein [Sphingomonas sp. AOB5]MDF7774695.1 hypothetical protein [Sphingomonas sp. AOB5]